MSCTSNQEQIALWIEGDLPIDQIAKVESHSRNCEDCRRFADEMKESQASLKNLRNADENNFAYQKIRKHVVAQIASDQKTRLTGSWFWRVVAIAAVMTAVALASTWLYSRWFIATPPDIPTAQERKEDRKSQPKDENRVVPSKVINQKKRIVVAQKEADIFGRVIDPNGVPLPGVVVTLQSNKGIVGSLPTNSNGNFRFSNLLPGNYSATFSLEGFGHRTQESIQIQPESNTRLLVTLVPSRSEEFVVVADTPVVDSKKMGKESTFNREYLDRVPAGRDPWVIVEQAPGADGDRIEIGGTESSETGYFARGPSPAPSPASPPPPARTLDPETEAKLRALGYITADPTDGGQKAEEKASHLYILEGRKVHAKPVERQATQGTLEARNSDGEIVGEFPLKHTEVTAEISGYLAKTLVEQQYTNPYREAIEAVYVFPLPAMAAVNDFVMEIGDQRIVGIVRPREEAERIYQDARARGQTASLLTQERPNLFTQNVTNIEAGGKVNIKITYFEKLVYERGYYEYVFPMVVGPRYIPGNAITTPQRGNSGGGWSGPTDQVPDADKITPPVLKPGMRSGHDIAVTIRLNAGLPIHDLKCVTHRVEIKEENPSEQAIKLLESDSIPNRDLVLRWSVAGGETQMGILAHRTDDKGFFTLLMQSPLNPADNQVTPREITFILDVSGSMSGIPLDMSKEIVNRTLDRMRPEDVFNIFIFAGGNAQLWNSPMPRTAQNIEDAKNFLRTLRGSGGTEMLAGVQRALSAVHDPKYLQMYAFLTDGYVGNEEEILRVVKTERGDARFFAFGIGSSVNRYLIDGIGKYGGGVSHVVLPRDQEFALRAADKFYECIDSPVLVDIEIDWNGLPVREIYPKKIQDLFAGQTIAMIGRFDGPAKGTAFVNARVGSRRVQYEIKMNLPEKQKAHAPLAAMWARHKIEELSESSLTAAEDSRQDLRKQITDLAVAYRLVSPYTAFVAVDESRVVGNGRPLRILQPVQLPENVSYEGVFGEQPVGQVMHISSWGMYLQSTPSGKIVICHVDPAGVSARSGIKPGAILKTVNRTLVHDMAHLNGLLLQAAGKFIALEFETGERVLLPSP